MRSEIALHVATGDILTFDADVVAFKHAEEFFGADKSAARALEHAGLNVRDFQPAEGDVALIDTHHALAAPRALFVGVPGPSRLRYSSIRRMAFLVLQTLRLRLPATEHVAMTIHGPGFGLDEVEALLSQVAGFVEALRSGEAPPSLRQITIIDRSPDRVEQICEALSAHEEEIGASLASESDHTWSLRIASGGTGGAATLSDSVLLDRAPDDQQHIFVALPFDDPMKDLFRYGIQKPAREAGFLCEHFADQPFIGDVLDNIKQKIQTSRVVIGVMTGDNPNVFLEIGYSWGVGRPTILVYQDGGPAPFDVRGQRQIRYASIGDLEDKLFSELKGLRQQSAI